MRLIINDNIMKKNSNLFKIKAPQLYCLHGVNTFLTVAFILKRALLFFKFIYVNAHAVTATSDAGRLVLEMSAKGKKERSILNAAFSTRHGPLSIYLQK